MGSKRMIVTISEADKKWLDGYSKAKDISVAEAVRQGICKLKEANSNNPYRTLAEKTIGVWRKGDGLEYQQRLRSEWNDE